MIRLHIENADSRNLYEDYRMWAYAINNRVEFLSGWRDTEIVNVQLIPRQGNKSEPYFLVISYKTTNEDLIDRGYL